LTFVRNAGTDQIIYTNSSNLLYDSTTNTISADITGNAATASELETNATGTNLTLSGDLTVNGSTVTLNTTTLDVSDLNITVASGAANSAAADGAGITVDGANATFNYSHNGTKWVANTDIEADAFIKNGGTSSQFLKADGSVDTSTYLTSFTETNDLSSAVTWANVPNVNITESSVTQHQAALSITESQISDLQTYLTTETNDLSSAVTWANVPNANITESSVTQHQAALSITESQISDLQTYLTSYTETDPVVGAISGIVKANGSGTISAAVANTDYLTPSGNGSSLTNVDAATLDGIDSSSFLRSDAADTKTSGNLTFNDDIRAQFGSSNDLLIYHKASSSNSIIEHTGTAGNLMLIGGATDNGVSIMADNSLGGIANYFVADGITGESILYYYGNQKLATKSNGVDITGTLTASADVTVKGAVRYENSGSTERFEILYNETTDSLDFTYSAS
jgi:hypothetical protein